VDAVYIATPPGSHELYAAKVLAAGKPCYVEKPMSRNAAEGRRMVEGFRAKGVPLFVAYYRRALPRFLKVKELVDTGVLGRIESVSNVLASGRMSRAEASSTPAWRMRAEESGAGIFMDMPAHTLDLLDFWFGPLKVVEATVRNEGRVYEVEDDVKATLASADGVPISLEAHFNSTKPADEFVLRGSAGEIRLSCFGNEMPRLTYLDGRVETFELPNPPHVAQPLIQSVVRELLGIGKCASTGETALRTQIIMDQILHDYYGGREDGFWKRQWPGNAAAH
jgi:predicted dehydrogenase